MFLTLCSVSQLQTIREAGGDPEDEGSDSEEGSSESEDDVPLRSTNPVITIYIDADSKEVATQTDPGELGSGCKCDVVLQKLDRLFEAVELMNSEVRVMTSDVYNIKQRCKAMESELVGCLTCIHVCMCNNIIHVRTV